MCDVKVLNSNTESVKYLCNKDKRLAKVISMVGEITYKAYSNGREFEFLVHEIVEQMLSTKAAAKIFERLRALCNKITPKNICNLSVEEIKSTGTSNSKAKSIKSLAEVVLNGDIELENLYEKSDEDIIKCLTKVHGIGIWTAKMFLIFVLDRQNVLPFEDVAFLQSYCWMYKTDDCSKNAIIKKCQKWKPYSSIAARYLYRSLDLGFTRKEFSLK